ncbi:5-formyltetrahydrofolate cyclo-ligase [Rubritalea sp.]|uniref:5-formyltetrahydrofolate cyclo-ligase n=1 Tax=Rubritalea sp. TaxID=2109375 RepID=UPI003EF98CD8
MDSELKQQKNVLRQKMRLTLKNLCDSEKKKQSDTLCECIAQYVKHNPQINLVATFASLPTEPDLSKLHASSIQLVYPLSHINGVMEFYIVEDIHSLRPGRYGILEPDPSLHQKVEPSKIDLFLVPAYAFTLEGKRLGKGGGYYDRLLAHRAVQSKLIGICFSCQILDSIPTEAHDIQVDEIIQI